MCNIFGSCLPYLVGGFIKPRLGGEPPWFQVLCCFLGYVKTDFLDTLGFYVGYQLGKEKSRF